MPASDNDTTLRFPRELRDNRGDEFAWWRSAEAEAANELHIRQMFAEPVRAARQSRSHFWAEVVIYAIAVGVFWAFVRGWL